MPDHLSAALAISLPAIGPLLLPAVAAMTGLNAGAMLLTLRAFRARTFRSRSHALVHIGRPPPDLARLRERRPAAGVAGVLLIVGGSYVLNLSARCRSLLGPLRALGRDPGVRAMLGLL